MPPKENPQESKDSFYSWTKGNAEEKKKALSDYSQSINEFCSIERTIGRATRSFIDVDSNVNVKSPFSRLDYEYFRPDEYIPRKQKEIIAYCMQAYDKVGIIKNIIDLMGDFGSQGIEIVHRSPRVQEFLRQWFKKVDGKERSERFLNNLYRMGNVIVRRKTSKFKESDLDSLRRSIAATDTELIPDFKPLKNEIPSSYIFHSPLAVEVLGGELSNFIGKPIYVLTLPTRLSSLLNQNNSDIEKTLMAKLPSDIRDAIAKKQKYIRLPEDKVSVYFYKKDDWLVWANPMVYSILNSLLLLEKYELMDATAADSAIASVRLWTMGSLEHEIVPTKTAINKLSNILTNNAGGGSYDLIWGPELTFKESSSEVYKLLTMDKYQQCYKSIYTGMGVPGALTGDSSGGFSKGFMELKTLVERLEYGRERLKAFWEQELKIVQKAMGFRHPGQVHFERINLSDEAAQMALLIQLVDRDLLSPETVLARFGEIPEIEKIRVRKEYMKRKKGKAPPKISSLPDANPEFALTKIFTQLGMVSPSEVGIELDEKKDGEKSKQDMMNEMAEKRQVAPKGQVSPGRPQNSKDKDKRKKKRVLPSSTATIVTTWARDAQSIIADIISPLYLEKVGKENLRQLNQKEFLIYEDLKAAILYELDAFCEITEDLVIEKLGECKGQISEQAAKMEKQVIDNFPSFMNRTPTIKDMKDIRSAVFGILNVEYK